MENRRHDRFHESSAHRQEHPPAHLQPYLLDDGSLLNTSHVLSSVDLNSQSTPNRSTEQKQSDPQFSSFLSDHSNPEKQHIGRHATRDVEELTNVSIARFRKQIESYRENLVTERLRNISLRNGQKSAIEELAKEKLSKTELQAAAERSQQDLRRLEKQFQDRTKRMEEEYRTSLNRKVSEITFLNQSIRTLQDSIASHKPNRLSQMVSKLTEQVAHHSERNQGLEREIEIREKSLQEKERTSAEQALAISRLEHKIEDGAIYCQQLQKHLDTKSKSETELCRELENKKRMIEKLTAQSNFKIQEVHRRHMSQENEMTQMRSCLMEEQQKSVQLQKQLKQAHHDLEQHNVEMLMLRNQLKEQSEIHNIQILKLTDSINHKERTNDGNVRRMYEENQRLSSDYARVLEENAQYQNAFVHSHASKEELNRLKTCLKAKDEQIELLQRDLLKHGQLEPTRTRNMSVQTELNMRNSRQISQEDVVVVDNIQENIKRLRKLIQTYVEQQEVDENILAELDCLPEMMSPVVRQNVKPADERSAEVFRETMSDIWIDTLELRRFICENMAEFIGDQCVMQ